jgi:hypothetical protein
MGRDLEGVCARSPTVMRERSREVRETTWDGESFSIEIVYALEKEPVKRVFSNT